MCVMGGKVISFLDTLIHAPAASVMRRLLSLAATSLGCVLAVAGLATNGLAASDPAKIVGPNACAECHKQEVEAWKGSHHFKTFRNMPRNALGKRIAGKMGIKRIKSEGLCLTCHYTVQEKDNQSEVVAGISCESCHSAGQDWIKVHSSYSGKKAETESKAEAKARWKLSEAKGMIRPGSIYRLAKNCFGCHVVPQEKLVNTGGHRAGSAFDLVAWSQGEVRHNTWHSKGKDNVVAAPERKRMLYLVGLGVELEMALRALTKATARKVFAFEMAQRAHRARTRLAEAAKAAPGVPELAEVVKLGHSASLKLGNAQDLESAADAVSKLLIKITEKYDGRTMAGLDRLVPGPVKFKGKARKPGAVN